MILDLMTKMPPAHRENVVYIDDNCRVFVNRPELRREVKLLERVRGNVYRTAAGEGEEVILPADEDPVPGPGEEAPRRKKIKLTLKC